MTTAEASPTAGLWGEVRTIGLVGLAHFISHFLMLAPAPLLPLMKAEFGVSYTLLGLVLTVFFATSGVGQVVAGVLVDRFGPHRLLLSGIALQAASVTAMAFAPSFLWLFPLSFAAGVGNTVYHPSDLSILSRRVTRRRQGRAFATHSMTGSLGFGLSPVLVGLAAASWGWRPALASAGLFGLVVAVTMLLNRSWLKADDFHLHAASEEERAAADGPTATMGFLQLIGLPVVHYGFAFFFLSTLAFAGLMNFTVAALTAPGYGVALAWATVAVAMLQFGSIGGTLAGGVVADRIGHHHRIAIVATLAAAVFVVPLAFSGLSLVLIVACLTVAGFFTGSALPSRDLLIRQAAPHGSFGRTFGTVYSGLDAGGLVGPLIIGPMLDRGAPQLLFVMAAISTVLATFAVVGIRRAEGRRG